MAEKNTGAPTGDARKETPDNEFSYEVENGALREVPNWHPYRNGHNWLAVIALDPSQRSGLARANLKKAGGDYFYLVDRVQRGHVLEFGADSYGKSNNLSRNRLYAAVVSITGSTLTIREFDRPREAVNEAKRILSEEKDPSELSDAERELAERLGTLAPERASAVVTASKKMREEGASGTQEKGTGSGS